MLVELLLLRRGRLLRRMLLRLSVRGVHSRRAFRFRLTLAAAALLSGVALASELLETAGLPKQ